MRIGIIYSDPDMDGDGWFKQERSRFDFDPRKFD